MVDKRRRSSGPCHKLNLGCGEERGEGEEKGERKERGEVGGGGRGGEREEWEIYQQVKVATPVCVQWF